LKPVVVVAFICGLQLLNGSDPDVLFNFYVGIRRIWNSSFGSWWEGCGSWVH